jgi:hypothetical protein
MDKEVQDYRRFLEVILPDEAISVKSSVFWVVTQLKVSAHLMLHINPEDGRLNVNRGGNFGYLM